MTSQGQSKFWCFTINNPKKGWDELNSLSNWAYIVAGKEVGDKGTKHLQCFVAYNCRTRFSTVKNQLPTAHIERMMGTPQQAADYCKKDGDYMEFGTLPDYQGGATGGQKKAENYRNIINSVLNGKVDDVIEIDPVCYVQHYHGLKRIAQDHPPKVENLEDVCGEWLVGPPGVGKSHLAREENPDHYDKAINKWWDGYQGEPCVIIDDMDQVHSVLGHHLKRWADKFPFPGEHKGTTCKIRPKKIVVTSNYTIEEIFGGLGDVLVTALTRRFKVREIESWVDRVQRAQLADFDDHSIHSQMDASEDQEISILDDDAYEGIQVTSMDDN